MTTKKHLKRRVRSTAARTGEPYATVLRKIRLQQENRMSPIADHIASCSFCTKPSTAVRRLVAGPGVYICDECVALSATIIADVDARTTPEESAHRRSPSAAFLKGDK